MRARCTEGTWPSPSAGRRRTPVTSSPSKRTVPRRARHEAVDAFSIVDLPAPFGPITATISSRVRAERDAVQHERVVVAGLEPVDLEQAHATLVARPEVRVDDALVAAHLVRRPCAITRPSFITITRSLARMTKSRSCSTIRSVTPSRSRRSRMCSSSSTRKRRADAGHRLVEQQDPRLGHQRAHEVEQLALPAGERAGERVRVAVEPHEREQLAARARASRSRRARRAAARPAEPLARMPRRREHDVLEHGHARQRARRLERADEPGPRDPVRRARGRSACRRGARGRTRGRRKPETQLKSVDLPAPFGPISAGDRAGARRRASRRRPRARRRSARTTLDAPRAARSLEHHLVPPAEDPLRPERASSPMITSPMTIRRT